MTRGLLLSLPSLVLFFACGGATNELEENAAGAGSAGQSGVAGSAGGSRPTAGASPGGASFAGAGGVVSEAGAGGSVAGTPAKAGAAGASLGGSGRGGVPSAGRSGGPSAGVPAAGRGNEAGAGGSGGATTDPRCPATSPSLSSAQPAEIVLACPPGITCLYSGINRCLCRREASGYCAQVDPTCGSMAAGADQSNFRALPAGGNSGAPVPPPPPVQACTCSISGWSCTPAL